MAACAACNRTILFGAKKVGKVRYCSQPCMAKGETAGTAVVLKKSAAGPYVVLAWAVVAVLTTAVNFLVDLSLAPKGIPARLALMGSLTFAFTPYLIAGICTLWKQYRNWHSFFKVAAILSLLLFVSSVGKLSQSAKL